MGTDTGSDSKSGDEQAKASLGEVRIGIDLGTTYCSVALYEPISSKADIIPNGMGREATPSVICFDGDKIAVGDEAKELQAQGKGAVASLFKKHMGDRDYVFEYGGKQYSAEDLSAILLKKLIDDTERRLQKKVAEAVVTVPAYFNDLQRRATIRAAHTAGLKVMKIVNEPTAAAVQYGYRHSGKKRILVYDLGGGTFDCSVVDVDGEDINVVGTQGEESLGGKDWDDILLNLLCDNFQKEYDLDPRIDGDELNRLDVVCEDYKKLLTDEPNVTATIECFGRKGGAGAGYKITRESFEAASQWLLEETGEVVKELLESLRLKPTDIDDVVLVGGASRMPMVKDYVESLGEWKVVSHRDAEFAVAKGAAILADIFSEKPHEAAPKFSEVTSHSLGVLAADPDGTRYVNDIVIPIYSSIPCTGRRSLRIEPKNRTDVIEVYTLQGESDIPLDCAVTARYEIRGFQNYGDSAVIDVEYSYSKEGTVTVSARQDDRKLVVTQKPAPAPEEIKWMGDRPGNRTVSVPIESGIVICIDLSHSMAPHIQEVKDVVNGFIREVTGPRTKVGLVGFADKVRTYIDMSGNTAAAAAALADMKVDKLGRGTDASPLLVAEDMLYNTDGSRIVVVLTDGIWGDRDRAVEEAEECRQNGVRILAIGFGDADLSFLKQIASLSDAEKLASLGDLRRKFSTIATEMAADSDRLREEARRRRRRGRTTAASSGSTPSRRRSTHRRTSTSGSTRPRPAGRRTATFPPSGCRWRPPATWTWSRTSRA
ncbi:MAG: Hsp70 family protein [Methanomethylophilus sp.]